MIKIQYLSHQNHNLKLQNKKILIKLFYKNQRKSTMLIVFLI
jgi:hypothetical protein